MKVGRLYTSDELGSDAGGGAPSGTAAHESYPTAGVRYGAMNWIGEFRLPAKATVRPGAQVVVQTDRGIELGCQAMLTYDGYDKGVSHEQIERYVEGSGTDFYRPSAGKILREASTQDVDEHRRLNEHIHEDAQRCEEVAQQLKLDMKVVTAEHLLGGERIVFYFRSEARVDFRELVRELAQYYQTRIEMRQVGARDEARLIADYEICGRECCCKNFLKKLRPVTMRMAKLQKSTLDPSKVSGRCGRLRCCLRYEHEGYNELAQKLPRIGTRVQTEFGAGTVVDRQVLTQLLLIRADDGRELTVPLEEVAPGEEAKPKPAADASQPAEPPTEPAEPTPDSQVQATDSEDEPPGPGEREGPPRRRRRSRRRDRSRKSDSAEPGKIDASDQAESEAPPKRPEPGPTPAPPKETHAEEEEAPTRARRRRGRRRPRPRRDRPDASAGTDGS